MPKRALFPFAAGALFLGTAACSAAAAPLDFSTPFAAGRTNALLSPVRSGGGGIHGGAGFGGMHGGALHAGSYGHSHFAGHSPFAGRAFARSYASHGHHFHGHRHHFFFAGYPYFYDDGYYDDDYGDGCWWSRRHHHWVCPDY